MSLPLCLNDERGTEKGSLSLERKHQHMVSIQIYAHLGFLERMRVLQHLIMYP